MVQEELQHGMYLQSVFGNSQNNRIYWSQYARWISLQMCTPFWQSLNMSVGWGAVEHIKFLSIYNTIAKMCTGWEWARLGERDRAGSYGNVSWIAQMMESNDGIHEHGWEIQRMGLLLWWYNEMCIMDFVVADGSVVSDAHAIHFGAVSRFLILSVKQMRWSVEHGSWPDNFGYVGCAWVEHRVNICSPQVYQIGIISFKEKSPWDIIDRFSSMINDVENAQQTGHEISPSAVTKEFERRNTNLSVIIKPPADYRLFG